jgi:spore germination cell wall hydrolase CwlJ-like protein
MSIIRKAVTALVVLSVLAFQSVSRAETQGLEGQPGTAGAVVKSASDKLGSFVSALATPVVDLKELQCLARNIFFEAANEPVEGKVAVGLVTINRMEDPRFPKTICGVVDQRVTKMVKSQGVREVKSMFGVRKEPVDVWSKLTICQFSWRCMFVKNPKNQDERWLESQQIARELLSSDYTYTDYRDKYEGALYFHATGIRPVWASHKKHVTRIGGHHFYSEKNSQAF